MININGLMFVRDEDALLDTLFAPINGKTADGFYRVIGNAVRLFRPDGTLFAAVVRFRNSSLCGFVSAGVRDGKPFFMNGMNSLHEEFLRLPKSYSDECELAATVFKQAREA